MDLNLSDFGSLLAKLPDTTDYENPDTLQSCVVNPPARIPLSGYTYNPALWTADDEIESTVGKDNLSPSDEELGNWPRRLLHIPTMTSQEWQPGNRYGNHVSPTYNAISYTWGRYDLDLPGAKKLKKYRAVKALHVNDVQWHIPKINPEHFSLEAFESLIRWTANVSIDLKEKKDPTEFLWLDIACIDQNSGPQKMAEIGRQAAIFHGAEKVFVWSTKHVKQSLEKLAASIAWSHEAFLCPHAHIVPLEGGLIPMAIATNQHHYNNLTLSGFCKASFRLVEICDSILSAPTNHSLFNEDHSDARTMHLSLNKTYLYLIDVREMLTQRGLLGLVSRNPVALYNVSQYRHCRYDYDRIYGIQQVFGFRLGETRTPQKGVMIPKKIDRYVLEEQLGEALVSEYPVTSQMHVFEEIVEEGRGWRPSPSSLVPDLDIKSQFAELSFVAECEVSAIGTTRAKRGYFKGRACNFSTLSQVWKIASGSHDQTTSSKSPQQIGLDACIRSGDLIDAVDLTISENGILLDGVEPITTVVPYRNRKLIRREEQNRLSWWINGFLKTYFKASDCIVLLLGSFDDNGVGAGQEKLDRYHVGLILFCIPGQSYWRRMGFCIWQYESEALNSARLNRDDWQTLKAEHGSTNWRNESSSFA
ncbi:uncharacterized protein KY384_000930 [Bacidia gigantensis]|uniref:uncharacterized protein n=1 Tax=Bacidia gigantensis TaxID=2732470 RepID=UPI001D048946|nr:uncharacterized protein KY384_000930 [Bacidia gigantensis]KAG8534087.1 hypothetical protein KY384_000930 [Bacidia gigantensis]